MNRKLMVLVGVLVMVLNQVSAQTPKKKKERKGEFYFSWGYNKEWYTQSDLFVDQPALGNNYVMKGIRANDHPGWDEGIFDRAISIPQYNYRIGYFFNKKKGLAWEINFDHTKYIMADQEVHVVGTYQHRSVDTFMAFNHPGSYYYLNNGANFLLFNIVKRWNLFESKSQNLKVDFLGKAGIGPVIPHVENSLFGLANDPHFQLGGWNVGVEGAIRTTFYKYVYLEYCQKMDYARYSGLSMNNGTAHQAFGTYEMILNLGFTIPAGKVVE